MYMITKKHLSLVFKIIIALLSNKFHFIFCVFVFRISQYLPEKGNGKNLC